MKNIKWIFFDVGETLSNEYESWKKRCILQSNTEECKKLNLSWEVLYQGIIEASINYLPQFRAVMDKYNIKEVIPYDASLETLYPNTIETLKIVSKKYKLGIIANQEDGLQERLANWGIDKYFDVVISSFDVNCHKPDEKIFNIAMSKANAKPEESMMVGDRLDNDIYPAKKLKMKTCWIKQGFGKYQEVKSDKYQADFVINTIDEFINIIK